MVSQTFGNKLKWSKSAEDDTDLIGSSIRKSDQGNYENDNTLLSRIRSFVSSNSPEECFSEDLLVHKVEAKVPKEKYNSLAAHLINYSVYSKDSGDDDSGIIQISLDDEELSWVKTSYGSINWLANPSLKDTLSSMVNLVEGFLSIDWNPPHKGKAESKTSLISEKRILEFSRPWAEENFWLKIHFDQGV